MTDHNYAKRLMQDALSSEMKRLVGEYQALVETLERIQADVANIGQRSGMMVRTPTDIATAALRALRFTETNTNLPSLVSRAAEYEAYLARHGETGK